MDIFKKLKPMPRDITMKWFIAIATCIALVSVIYIGKIPYGGQPQVGKVADRNIYAPLDFSFNAGEDTEKTEGLKKDAALSVKDIYDIDPILYENECRRDHSHNELKNTSRPLACQPQSGSPVRDSWTRKRRTRCRYPDRYDTASLPP